MDGVVIVHLPQVGEDLEVPLRVAGRERRRGLVGMIDAGGEPELHGEIGDTLDRRLNQGLFRTLDDGARNAVERRVVDVTGVKSNPVSGS
jgi:hypothetical protein